MEPKAVSRTNEQWLADLRSATPPADTLEELRDVLRRGLGKALAKDAVKSVRASRVNGKPSSAPRKKKARTSPSIGS